MIIEDALSLLDAVAEAPRVLTADEIHMLRAEICRLQSEVTDYDRSFELRWAADRRAIKRWQNDRPGRELSHPDHADLVVWLMNQWDEAEAALPTPDFDEP